MRIHLFVLTLGASAAILVMACTGAVNNEGVVNLPNLPPLGSTFSPPVGTIAMSFRGGLVHSYAAAVKGIRYSIGIDTENGEVIDIQSFDPSFSTPEGVRAGDLWKETAFAEGVLIEGPFFCSFLLPSGWVAHVNTDQFGRCTPEVLTSVYGFTLD